MLSFIVHGPSSAAALYAWELTLQCQIGQHVYQRLEEFSRVQNDKDFDASSKRPENPVEVFSDCAAFLSSAAIIAKILFAGDGSTPDKRRKNKPLRIAHARALALRSLLGVGLLPTLRSIGVRNAFEHIDERLDRQLEDNLSGRFVWLNTTSQQDAQTLALKWFNPRTLELSYLGEALDLRACNLEMKSVRLSAEASHKTIRSSVPLLSAPTA